MDRLLLVGMLRDEDVEKLLIMINPETWDPEFQKGIKLKKLRTFRNNTNFLFQMVLTNTEKVYYT